MIKIVSFKYKPVKYNKGSRNGRKIEYIIIHDTANTSAGANAYAHYRFFSQPRSASAHYFVDDREIIQIVGDDYASWHCGDNQGQGRYLNGACNQNSIGIELCINRDGDYGKAYEYLVELTKNLMKKFNISADKVQRHYDVSRKICPGTMSADNWAKWRQFKEEIKKPLKIYLDLDRDSEGVELGADEEYFEKNNLKIIKVPADRIYIQQLRGKTLREVGAYGINGTFFDTPHPELSKSTWSIALNNGKPIGENSHTNGYDGTLRATIVYGDGKLTIERINDISEIKRKVSWAIGGVGLIPSYNPKLERVPADILRTTAHTAMAFIGTTVYLIVCKYISVEKLISELKDMNCEGAILLDGGGSTQMFWKDGKGIHTARKLNNIVGIK